MGWTVCYEGRSESGAGLSAAEQELLTRHVKAWNSRLSDDVEEYSIEEEFVPSGSKLSGWTKIQSSQDPVSDFLVLFDAVSELQRVLLRYRFSICDDYVLLERVEVAAMSRDELVALLRG